MSAIEIMETHFHSHSHRILRNLDNTFLKKYQKKGNNFGKTIMGVRNEKIWRMQENKRRKEKNWNNNQAATNINLVKKNQRNTTWDLKPKYI